jgi:beta-lactamase class A
MDFYKTKVPFPLAIVFFFLGALATMILLLSSRKVNMFEDTRNPKPISPIINQCASLTMQRLNGYSLIKPLVMAQPDCEAPELQQLKYDITSIIETDKRQGNLKEASVYVKELNTSGWIAVDDNALFYPGSLIKIPIMIAILKMEEAHPGFINKKITYNKGSVGEIKQTFNSKDLQPSQTYSIKELLEYMVAYSDNAATQLLGNLVDDRQLSDVFTKLNITAPEHNVNYLKYKITAKDYSKFVNSIYNAGYLSINESEYAAELMSRCDFKMGLVSGLDQGTRIIHKFGEAGHPGEHELHESGIVFLNNTSYLVTVMTKGEDVKLLPQTISQISGAIFSHFKKSGV